MNATTSPSNRPAPRVDFSALALIRELAAEGLRVAGRDESGWYYRAWDGSKVWVTKI